MCLGVLRFADLNYRQQFFQQGRELQFGEQGAQRLDIRFAGLHGVNVELDGNVGIDSG